MKEKEKYKVALRNNSTYGIAEIDKIELKAGMVVNMYGPKGEYADKPEEWLETICTDISENHFNNITKCYTFVLVEGIDGKLIGVPYFDTYVDNDIFINNDETGFTYTYIDREAYPDTLGFKPSKHSGYVIASIYQGMGFRFGNQLYKFCLTYK